MTSANSLYSLVKTVKLIYDCVFCFKSYDKIARCIRVKRDPSLRHRLYKIIFKIGHHGRRPTLNIRGVFS